MANVLLVDDDPAGPASISKLLTRWGHRATILSSGEEALRFLDRHSLEIDAVLTDFRMPGMMGTELISIIQEDPRFRHIRLALASTEGITAIGEPLERWAEAHGVRFLPKPIDLSELKGFLDDLPVNIEDPEE